MGAFKFLFQLTLGAVMFLPGAERKDHFWRRLVGAFLMAVAICLLNDRFREIFLRESPMLSSIGQYLVAFLLVVWIVKSVVAVSWMEALFVSSSGYALQNAAHYVFVILYALTRSFGMNWNSSWLDLLSFLVIYIPAWIFARRLPQRSTSMIAMKSIVILSLMVLFFTIILSANVPLGGTEYLLYYVYSLFSALMVLFLQYGICEKTHLMYERDMIRRMLYLESKQHKLSEDTVTQINLKCHDLKHQLHSIAQKGQISQAAVEELNHAIRIYDATFQTGNPAVDVILTEKALRCEKSKIELCCILDGKKFDFMRPEDIYALFGNALDNAIECVETEPQESRFIAIKCVAQGELICLHVENYCSRERKFVNGMPVTTKTQEPGLHGYGSKSICFLAEKYGGSVLMRQEGQQFILDVILPAEKKTVC